VALLALAIGEPTDGEEIGSVEQTHAILERQSLASLQLVVDVGQSGRLKSQFHSTMRQSIRWAKSP
jgi:hypothetical protein